MFRARRRSYSKWVWERQGAARGREEAPPTLEIPLNPASTCARKRSARISPAAQSLNKEGLHGTPHYNLV